MDEKKRSTKDGRPWEGTGLNYHDCGLGVAIMV